MSKRMMRIAEKMLVCIEAALLLIAIVGLIEVCGRDTVGREDFTSRRVVVRQGETAWSIADRFCPPDVDKREYLAWCAEANGLCGMGALRAGEMYIFLEVRT